MENTTIATQAPFPVLMPTHVRRFCQRIGDGSSVQVLRDSVVVATFLAEGRHVLNNVREIVSTDVAKRGDAIFTVAVDDFEVQWETAATSDTGRGDGGVEADARSFGRTMEAFGFRALDKAMDAVQRLNQMATEREKVAAKNAKMHARALKVLARMMRKHGQADPEVEKLEIEAAQEVERLDMVKAILPRLFGEASKPAKGASALASTVLGFLDAEEKASVLATREGKLLQSASDDDVAAVALRALWQLVADGTVQLKPQTIQQAMAAFGGSDAA